MQESMLSYLGQFHLTLEPRMTTCSSSSQNVAKYHLVWEKRVKSQYCQEVILLIDVTVVCSMNIFFLQKKIFKAIYFNHKMCISILQVPNPYRPPALHHSSLPAQLLAPGKRHAAHEAEAGGLLHPHGGKMASGLLQAGLPAHPAWLRHFLRLPAR